jgi:hypothetical protein
MNMSLELMLLKAIVAERRLELAKQRHDGVGRPRRMPAKPRRRSRW